MIIMRLLLLAIATVLVVVYGKNDPPGPLIGPPPRPQSNLAGGGLVAVGSITVLSLAGKLNKFSLSLSLSYFFLL